MLFFLFIFHMILVHIAVSYIEEHVTRILYSTCQTEFQLFSKHFNHANINIYCNPSTAAA